MDYQLTHMHTIGTGRDDNIDAEATESTQSTESTRPGCVHLDLGNGTSAFDSIYSGVGQSGKSLIGIVKVQKLLYYSSVPEIHISNRERSGITQIKIILQRKILTTNIISLKFSRPSKHSCLNVSTH